MPRKKTFRNAEFPYHIVARSSNQEWFYLPMEQMWQIFSNYLWFITFTYKIRVHAFVMMSNHFHLLVSTPEANIDEAMNYFMREVSKTVGIEAKRKNQIFGGPYHWSVIKNPIYYNHAYKYIYRNPVHAGICTKVEDYKYSTLPALLGRVRADIPVLDNMCIVQDPYKQLAWLNQEFEEGDREAIKKALKHPEFKFQRDPINAKKHRLEERIV